MAAMKLMKMAKQNCVNLEIERNTHIVLRLDDHVKQTGATACDAATIGKVRPIPAIPE